MKFDIAGLVDAMDVAESGRYREIWTDGAQRLVNLIDILRLGIQ